MARRKMTMRSLWENLVANILATLAVALFMDVAAPPPTQPSGKSIGVDGNCPTFERHCSTPTEGGGAAPRLPALPDEAPRLATRPPHEQTEQM
jgi:hypothetical protein